eukprot:4860845-Pleurochrysis_carterae.AAC.1
MESSHVGLSPNGALDLAIPSRISPWSRYGLLLRHAWFYVVLDDRLERVSLARLTLERSTDDSAQSSSVASRVQAGSRACPAVPKLEKRALLQRSDFA